MPRMWGIAGSKREAANISRSLDSIWKPARSIAVPVSRSGWPSSSSLGDRRPAAYSARMTVAERSQRLAQLAAAARAAEARGDGWHAGDAWRRYELVRDGGRDPDELIAEGIAFSRMALDLAGQAKRREA